MVISKKCIFFYLYQFSHDLKVNICINLYFTSVWELTNTLAHYIQPAMCIVCYYTKILKDGEDNFVIVQVSETYQQNYIKLKLWGTAVQPPCCSSCGGIEDPTEKLRGFSSVVVLSYPLLLFSVPKRNTGKGFEEVERFGKYSRAAEEARQTMYL